MVLQITPLHRTEFVLLARFRKWHTLILACFLLVLIIPVLMLWYAAIQEAGGIVPYVSEHPARTPLIIFGWSGSIILILILFIAIERIIIEDSKAVWIRNGVLIYLHKYFISISCTDIKELSIGTFSAGILLKFDYKCINIIMRNGSVKQIPTAALRESAEEIASHIMAILHREVKLRNVVRPNIDE